MKPFKPNVTAAVNYAGLLENIEILRSNLRWASSLDRNEIQKLLRRCNTLRDDVLSISRQQRFQAVAKPNLVDKLDFDTTEVEPLRRKAAAPVRHRPTNRRQALVDRDFVFEGVFGESPKLLETLEIGEKAAPTELPVLIRGESGTGKELMAKVIHANSKRSDEAFISVNCGAIPENLLESELFGHKKGAFTGASSDRKGKFESADQGTIFLDEIGELPLSGQVKLLRVLQSQEIQRVGSDSIIYIDARIVAATNRNLLAMVREGTFREDLYYRLSVIEVTLPALRERVDEIPLLIDFFSAEAAEQLQRKPLQLTEKLLQFLLDYSYPGNIRELRNIIFRMSCLAPDTADLYHLPETVRSSEEQPEESVPVSRVRSDPISKNSLSQAKKIASDAAERRFLETGLKEVDGRVVELAKRSGMNRSHLQTLMKKHGLSAKDFRYR